MTKKIYKKVLVGGGFDLIHAGHIYLLKYAKQRADKLVVAVLSDKYIKTYKDRNRPIIKERYRLMLVNSTRYVDSAFLCDKDPYSTDIIKKICPDAIILERAASREKKRQEAARRIRGEFPQLTIIYCERDESDSLSTTHIINKIKNQ